MTTFVDETGYLRPVNSVSIAPGRSADDNIPLAIMGGAMLCGEGEKAIEA
jgi:hypothetical protein